jgi:hypothetical protein
VHVAHACALYHPAALHAWHVQCLHGRQDPARRNLCVIALCRACSCSSAEQVGIPCTASPNLCDQFSFHSNPVNASARHVLISRILPRTPTAHRSTSKHHTAHLTALASGSEQPSAAHRSAEHESPLQMKHMHVCSTRCCTESCVTSTFYCIAGAQQQPGQDPVNQPLRLAADGTNSRRLIAAAAPQMWVQAHE